MARGCAYANHGKFAEGVVDLKKALRLDPDHSNAKTYLETILRDTGIKDEFESRVETPRTPAAPAPKPTEDRDFVFDEDELAAAHGSSSKRK